MPKDDAGPAVRLDGPLETTALTAPVLAVGLGRGAFGYQGQGFVRRNAAIMSGVRPAIRNHCCRSNCFQIP